MNAHEQLIADSADLCDFALEPLTATSMAIMEVLLQKIELSISMASAMPAMAQG